jgi:sodium-coupled neutral amino acid transporter 11
MASLTQEDPEIVLLVQSADEHDDMQRTNNVITQEQGSSVAEATFNFTNSVIGAGAIGLGGAMAVSGGLVSVILILLFGCLTKISLDMVIRLSVETPGADGSYENLAYVGAGRPGRLVVMICKLLYSFGCLVAYIVVLKDNMAPALRHMIYGSSDDHNSRDWFHKILTESVYFTWLVSLCLILPLCLLRDMTPLASLSVVSVVSMISIVGMVIYMYFCCPEIGVSGGSNYEKWLEIRPGVVESLGTFVFTFVSQHTVHLTFGSLKPSLRTVANWKRVSSLSLGCATAVSLSVGVFVYMTFWQSAKSDIFEIYPQGWMIDLAKLLLGVTMVLTFPLPFFTCRELLIVTFIHPWCGVDNGVSSRLSSSRNGRLEGDLQEPLLETGDAQGQEDEASHDSRISDVVSIASEVSRRIAETATPKNWLLPGDDRQLQLPGHVGLTVKLWVIVTILAIAAPSLGDVLNLVGCASGTVIAFLLPALLSLKIEGYSSIAMFILCIGAIVGTLGTFFSLKKLVLDLKI